MPHRTAETWALGSLATLLWQKLLHVYMSLRGRVNPHTVLRSVFKIIGKTVYHYLERIKKFCYVHF